MRILNLFLPLWYPFSIQKMIQSGEVYKTKFFSDDYVIYKTKNGSLITHTNICPHQGGHFCNGGFLDQDQNIVCPYHGFTYNTDGNFLGICNQPRQESRLVHQETKKKRKQHMKTYKIKETEDLLFMKPNETKSFTTPDIFFPPEEYDRSFRGVSGYTVLSNNYLTVTENLLDMLHISFVHSFGSTTNVPKNISFEEISEIHGKTSFYYYPAKRSLGSLLSLTEELDTENKLKVMVENEYCLPTNTITRVYIEDSIKTVFTRSIPMEDNKTLLYWKLYRNFWTDNFVLQYLGDFLVQYLMNKVIQEDIQILKNMNVNDRNGSIKTIYDKTILEFRKAMDKNLNGGF